MSRNRREHGRIISVETHTRGDALAEDVAAGATSITVEDAGDFDEDGGWLTIGGQVVEFSECDDDTGVITLVTALAAAAEQGDPVAVWSDLYEEVVEYQQALVELDGEYDNPDPVVAEVAQGLGLLPEGDRGKAGESCTLHRVAADEWEVAGVGGAPVKAIGAAGSRWEADDAYVLTADDITTGAATIPLSHVPEGESVDARWRTTPQEPTEYTVNHDTQTVTWPLSGFEAAGDRLWFHYTYRKTITTPVASSALFESPKYDLTLVYAAWVPSIYSGWMDLRVRLVGNVREASASGFGYTVYVFYDTDTWPGGNTGGQRQQAWSPVEWSPATGDGSVFDFTIVASITTPENPIVKGVGLFERGNLPPGYDTSPDGHGIPSMAGLTWPEYGSAYFGEERSMNDGNIHATPAGPIGPSAT